MEPFLRSHPDANSEPLDIEDLVSLGKSANGPCPYFLSREMASNADIIFMPVRALSAAMHPAVAAHGTGHLSESQSFLVAILYVYASASLSWMWQHRSA